MYLEYWGLKKFPFDNVPDPEFMYYSPTHNEALARLLYAVKGNKGIILITGEIGSGKTTLSRVLIDQIESSEFDIGLMVNSVLDPIDFLREILYSLGVKPDKYLRKSDLLKLLNEKALKNFHDNKSTLLIFDEAHLISEDTLEEIRLLLNFQLNNKFLLTIILLGQSELNSIVKKMKQLYQRIGIKYHLTPLSHDETSKYIEFRLKEAGSVNNIINKKALDEIYAYSNGIPRMINNICDISLMAGFISNTKVVGPKIVKESVLDLS